MALRQSNCSQRQVEKYSTDSTCTERGARPENCGSAPAAAWSPETGSIAGSLPCRRLPPLTALRAFEAAGRHLSITRAADELCVTAAAVSHQVKTLEDYLEVRLFRRTGNSLFLTDAGQAFLPGLRAGFAELERAMSALREHDLRGAFVLSVAPVFATRWLIPRLDGFHGAHPDIDVRISATLELADFERDGIDAAIRVGRGRYPGAVARLPPGSRQGVVCGVRARIRAYRLDRDAPCCRPPRQRQHHLHHRNLIRRRATVGKRTLQELTNPNLLQISRHRHQPAPAAHRLDGVSHLQTGA